MNSEALENTLWTFRWVSRALLGLSILCAILFLFPNPESTALLLPVDQRMFFDCLSEGCWNRVRVETSFAEIAKRTRTNERLLREGNPHIHGDVVHTGDEIRISNAMSADR